MEESINFNEKPDNLPFYFKSHISFMDDNINFDISLTLTEMDNYLVEVFSNDIYKTIGINKNNPTLLVNCDIKYGIFFKIFNTSSRIVYYGFYSFDIVSIPDDIKPYFINKSDSYKDGLKLLINEKYNYNNLDNPQYRFTPYNNDREDHSNYDSEDGDHSSYDSRGGEDHSSYDSRGGEDHSSYDSRGDEDHSSYNSEDEGRVHNSSNSKDRLSGDEDQVVVTFNDNGIK